MQTQECIISAIQSKGGPSVVCVWVLFQKFKFCCQGSMAQEWYESVLLAQLDKVC